MLAQKEPDLGNEHDRLIAIAYSHAAKVMEIPDSDNALYETNGDIITITFPFPDSSDPSRPRAPGPDYLARVKIDRATGDIIEILGAR